jgi:hypothetical protein
MSCVAFADTSLPKGYVKGLPDSLVVTDEDGKTVDNDNGELFISIDNMQPNEVYTKDIAVTNLREDRTYSIYMFAEPNYTKGNVDMLGETVCRLWLDDKLIYEGAVDGSGTPDMRENGIDLGGEYYSGEARKLHAEFVWNWSGKTTYDTGDNTYYGELSFKWIFYAHMLYEGGGDITHSGDGGKTDDKITPTVVPNEPLEEVDNPSGTDTNTNTETTPNNPDTQQPADTPSSDNSDGENSGEVDLHNSGSDPADKVIDRTMERIIERIIDKTPLPEDVKTGYHSELVFYIKLLIAAVAAAAVIACIIVYKAIRLKRVRDRS